MKTILLCRILILPVLVLGQPSRAEVPVMDSGHVEVDGGRLFYEEAGSGPTIVLIHDGLLHRESWDAQFTEFARDHRVIRYDRRGYGRSDPPEAIFSNVTDLLAVMDALEVEEATLMGCSVGGLLVIDFTLVHPERVSSMVLVGPIVSGLSFSEHLRRRGDRGMPSFDAPVAEQVDYWAWKDPWSTAPESKAAKETVARLLTENPQDLTQNRSYARYNATPSLSRLSEIHVPTLLVAGEADAPDVHAHVGAIEAGITGAQRVVLMHCGHLVHLEVPEEFNKLVRTFLEMSAHD